MADDASADLAAACLALVRALQPWPPPTRALALVAEHAAAAVPGADCASVAVLQRGTEWRIVAHTDERARVVERARLRSGDGPEPETVGVPGSGTARAAASVVRVADTAGPRARWTRFSAAADVQGVRSALVCPLWSEREQLGALSLYSTVPHAFDDASADAAALFGGYASLALSHGALVDSLRAGLASRQSIGEATGILMERYKVRSAEAFEMLVAASQRLNTKLRDIATRVVETDRSPQELTRDPEAV